MWAKKGAVSLWGPELNMFVVGRWVLRVLKQPLLVGDGLAKLNLISNHLIISNHLHSLQQNGKHLKHIL